MAKSYAASECMSFPEVMEREAAREAVAAATGGGGEAGGEGGGGVGPVAEARLAEPTLQAAPSAPCVIEVIARIVPSAEATLVSPAEAALYETADAEATSCAV